MLESITEKLCHLTDDEFHNLHQSEILYFGIGLMAMSDAELSSLCERGLCSAVKLFVQDIIAEHRHKRSYLEQLEEERLYRNESVEELLALYTNRKSGKVVDARKKLQKRYMHFSYDDQILVMRTMLKGGKIDRDWCYNTLRKRWTDEIIDDLMAVWHKHKEERCGWLITLNSSVDVIIQNIEDLDYESNYYNLCKRLVSQDWFHIDREKLRNSCMDDSKYLWIISQSKEWLTEDEALDVLYHWIAQVLQRMNPDIVIQNKSDKPNHVSDFLPDYGEAYNLTMLNYRMVRNMLTSMCAMGMEKAVERFIEHDKHICSEFCRIHNIYLQDLSEADEYLVKQYGSFYALNFPASYYNNHSIFFSIDKNCMEEQSEDKKVGVSKETYEEFITKHPYVNEMIEKLELEPIISEDTPKNAN